MDISPYPIRQVKPYTRLALRVGLWAAVVLGAVCGIAAVVISLAGDEPVDAEGAPAEDFSVPAPVAGTAELVVQEWLVATTSDAGAVDPLFVEAPDLARDGSTEGREILAARAVSGEKVADGYWAVTVAVDLVDLGDGAVAGGESAEGDAAETDEAGEADETDESGEPVEEDGAESESPPADDSESQSQTVGGAQRWYVEVGIVGVENGALAALRTPAIVPPPGDVEEGWSTQAEEVIEPGASDLETVTIRDFLRAVLVGEGDVTRYVASGVEIPAVSPPPFADLEVTRLTAEPLNDDADVLRFQVSIEAATAGGGVQPAAYEIVAEWRDGRLEVLELWGAASLAGRPTTAADATTAGAETDAADESGEAE